VASSPVDWEALKWKLLLALWKTQNEWRTFHSLALELVGDPNFADVLESIANGERTLFAVQERRRIKLTSHACQLVVDALEANQPGLGPTTEPKRHLAARLAVQRYANQLHPYQITVRQARRIQRIRDRYLHALTISEDDDDIRLVDDTPVTLISAQRSTNSGYVVGTSRNDSTLFVALQYDVLASDLPAKLVIYRNKIWMDLAERLSQLNADPAHAIGLSDARDSTVLVSQSGQNLAFDLARLDQPWSKLLWGPPGSGKTFCVARLASILMDRPGDRVLVLAPSNVAVDTATLELAHALEKLPFGPALVAARRVVRFGYPRAEELLEKTELLAPDGLEELSRQILEKHRLVRRMERSHAPAEDIATAHAELHRCEEDRKNRIAEHIRHARIVATTIASVCMGGNPIIQGGPWNTVILDECSMINGAMVLFLSSLPQQRFLLAGDPRQLAPVFEWGAGHPPPEITQWLARDPFEAAGLSTGSGIQRCIKVDDVRVARILSQRRCHPRIWSAVSPLYPAVITEVPESDLAQLAALPPDRGNPIVLLDLSSSDRVPTQQGVERDAMEVAADYECSCRRIGRSWENPSTAMLAIDVAQEIRANSPDAGLSIITPYRAQARLIRNWLDDEARAGKRTHQLDDIAVGTVHSFQGGQADVVIFDIVDGPPRDRPGALLQGDGAMRLGNVALTRARGKLIIIAHRQWLRATTTREGLGVLWDVLFGNEIPLASWSVLPPSPAGRPQHKPPGPESPIEEIFVAELGRRRNELPSFVLQHQITDTSGRIISRADIAFVKEKVAIYCDGEKYHLQSHQWRRDLRQRRKLESLGWTPLGFYGREIKDDVAGCVQEIIDFFGGQQMH